MQPGHLRFHSLDDFEVIRRVPPGICFPQTDSASGEQMPGIFKSTARARCGQMRYPTLTTMESPAATGAVLITGGNGGIGLELARLFAADGYSLVLVARDAERLRSAAEGLRKQFPGTVATIAHNLSAPHAARELWQQIAAQGLEIDILVNNAGVGLYGPFAETDAAKEAAMMQLNMVSLTELTKLALPGMLARKHGKILNISSVAAFQPGPLMAVYYASKAYVLSFSEALAEELRGSGVTVTALCPGTTRTGFEERAELGASALFRTARPMSAERVARAGYRGLMRGRAVVIPGMHSKIATFLVRITPRALVRRVVKYVQRRVN